MIKTEQDTKNFIKQNNVFEFRTNFSWMTLLDGLTHALPNAHARVKKYKLQDAIEERNAVESLVYDVIEMIQLRLQQAKFLGESILL